MFNAPRTKQEALKVRYGQWAGNPKGTGYNETRCAYEVWNIISRQCSRKNGKGPGGLYCGTHAKFFDDKK